MSITLSLDQAREKFIAAVSCTQLTEHVALADGLLRVAASDVVSQIDVPPCNNSAMDGFAVNSSDLAEQQTTLIVSQRIPAGSRPLALEPGTAARIFTGGNMPTNANAVVIQENCEFSADSDQVTILKPVVDGQNVRPQGQDISIGTAVVKLGKRLSAVDLGLIASVGRAQVEVYKQLRVAIFSTGNELAQPGEQLEPGQIYNSNRTMLMALCQQLGFIAIDCGIVEDTLQATEAALKAAAQTADVIITSGGVSVGEEDHIKPAIQALGELNHWKVQMKPGKPVVLGQVLNTPVLGLPGNPVSSYVVFQLLGIPLLRALQGQHNEHLQAYSVISGFDKKPVSREEFIRVRVSRLDDGQPLVELFDNQSSGVLSSLSWADGLVRQSIDQSIAKGDTVRFLPLNEGLL